MVAISSGMATFHEKLRTLMELRGFTNEEVARACDVSAHTVSNWRGRAVPKVPQLATLAELCGHAAPKEVHGRSFAELVRNRRYTPREFAYSEYYFCRKVFTRDDRYVGKPPILMVRTGKWKLNYLSWARSELFDLQKDPGEFHNAIEDTGNSGIVRELTAMAQRMFAA